MVIKQYEFFNKKVLSDKLNILLYLSNLDLFSSEKKSFIFVELNSFNNFCTSSISFLFSGSKNKKY